MIEEYVANSAYAWARANTEYDVVAKLAGFWPEDAEGPAEFGVARVEGFNGIAPVGALATAVDADEVLEVTRFEVPRNDWMRLREHVCETDYLVEDCIVGNEIEEE